MTRPEEPAVHMYYPEVPSSLKCRCTAPLVRNLEEEAAKVKAAAVHVTAELSTDVVRDQLYYRLASIGRVCVYTYIHTYIHTYLLTYLHTYINYNIHIYIYI